MISKIRTTEKRASKETFKCVAVNISTGKRNCFYSNTAIKAMRWAKGHINAQNLQYADFVIEEPVVVLSVSGAYA